MTTLNATLTPLTVILIDENFRGFNGEIFDSASATYLLGNGYRAYHPAKRTFLSRDSLSPFGPGGANRYQYCQFDPINYADPSGHLSENASLGITLGILSLVLGLASLGSALPLIFAAGASAKFAWGVIGGTAALVAGSTGISASVVQDPVTARNLGLASLAFGAASSVGIGAFTRTSAIATTLNSGQTLSNTTKLASGFGVLGTTLGTTSYIAGEALDNGLLRNIGIGLQGVGGVGGLVGLRAKQYRSGAATAAADELSNSVYSNNYRTVGNPGVPETRFINTIDRSIGSDLRRWNKSAISGI